MIYIHIASTSVICVIWGEVMRIYVISRQKLLLILFPMIAFVYCGLSLLYAGQTLTGKIIIVDAGHGGIDPGANRPGVLEKEINLAIGLNVREDLRVVAQKWY